MSPNQAPPGATVSETKRLFASLNAFFSPAAEAAGLKLRPFSLATFTAMQCAGISVGSEAFAKLTDEERVRQLIALLVIQTAPIGTLAGPLRKAAGDFDAFYWSFVFERADAIPADAMLALEDQLGAELPAIEAAQVEVATPASLEGGKEEVPPGK